MRVLSWIKLVALKGPFLSLNRLNADMNSLFQSHCDSRLTKDNSMLSKQDAFSRSTRFDVQFTSPLIRTMCPRFISLVEITVTLMVFLRCIQGLVFSGGGWGSLCSHGDARWNILSQCHTAPYPDGCCCSFLERFRSVFSSIKFARLSV